MFGSKRVLSGRNLNVTNKNNFGVQYLRLTELPSIHEPAAYGAVNSE